MRQSQSRTVDPDLEPNGRTQRSPVIDNPIRMETSTTTTNFPPTLTIPKTCFRIAGLNDMHRRSRACTMMTAATAALPRAERDALLRAITAFDGFNWGNDPYGEQDFGAVALADERYFFKVDYYDKSLTFYSPDLCDATVTRRVMTVMRADEY